MERTRYDNTDHSQDENRPERVGRDEHKGDMDYTQNSAHRKLLVTDSLTLTTLACGVQENTNREREWTYAETLPHDLAIPDPDSRQRVPLYRRSSCSSKIMNEVDTKDRGPYVDERTRLGMMERRGGDRTMDPCRDTIDTELRIRGAEMIPDQNRVYETPEKPSQKLCTRDVGGIGRRRYREDQIDHTTTRVPCSKED